MSEKPFISVMVLCYNYSSLLKKTLEACAKQSFKDFEIVMINNGSTDDTEDVFKAFCAANPDILTQYVLVEKNQGPTHGWNVGLPYARGEYVLFNDADDWMEPDCLDKLAQAAKKTGAQRVMGQYQEVLPNGTVSRVRSFPEKSSIVPTTMLQGVIFKKAVISDNNIMFPENVYIPYDFAFSYAFATVEENKPELVYSTVYNYFYNPKSLTQKMQRENYCDNCLKNNIFPLIDITSSAMKNAEDKELKNAMEYLCVRNNYAAIVTHYKQLTLAEADKFYEKVTNELKNKLPHYKKNPLIKPFNNGYETAGSVAVWGLILLEKIKVFKLAIRIIKNLNNSKLLRDTTQEEK